MPRLPRLAVDSLESRETPATFGHAWPDAERLTLSFAPDGTSVSGRENSLAEMLPYWGPNAQRDVLRAFQSWAVHANVNFGLVTDDGTAFGTGGAVQGDPRFGDVRIGGVALPADVLAVTSPYGPLDNYSGNVVVNTTSGYDTGIDLYTTMLQEAGHALGVGNSPNQSSAMYEYYRGLRSGLSDEDIAAIQALYGPRVADRYEGWGGNDTRSTATVYTGPLAAELTTTTDADVYRIATGLLTRTLTVNLRAAGLSLLTAKVEVLDANGNRVAALAATDPTNNNVTIALDSPRRLSTYFVRVSATDPTAFGVGAYQLGVSQDSLVTDITGAVFQLLDETGLNDTLFTATSLVSKAATVTPRTEFSTTATFGSTSDRDVYRLIVPPSTSSEAVHLLTTIWGHDGVVLDPWIEVTDAAGNNFAAEVVTANGNTSTIQLRNVTPGRAYFLKVTSDSNRTGAYTLAADLRTDPVELNTGLSQNLTAATPAVEGEFELSQSSQIHFVLTATSQRIEAMILADDGTMMTTISASDRRGRSADVFLPAGRYTIRVRSLTSASAAFTFGGVIVSDPIGATAADPTGTPEPTSPSPTTPPPSEPAPAEPTQAQPSWNDPAFWY